MSDTLDDVAVADGDDQPSNTIVKLTPLLHGPGGPGDHHGQLWRAWRFLQIFSTYGLRLPHTEASLKLRLGMSDPGAYLFFDTMREGYNEIHDACEEFMTVTFKDVIGIGRNLLDFASEQDPADGDIFSVLTELLDDNDQEGALDLIGDLRETALTNKKKAGRVQECLSAYKTKLESAQAKVNDAKAKVQECDQTSQETIDRLTGGPEVQGSLTELRAFLDKERKERNESLVAATTTVTYFWIAPPVGIITAGVIAGVYGVKAVEQFREIDRLEQEILANNAKLNTAIQTHKVMNTARESLAETILYTELALQHTTTVQNAWDGVAGNLEVIFKKVSEMTKTRDEQEVLKARGLIKSYAKKSAKEWAAMVPALRELTTDPYITVDTKEMSLGDFAEEVQKEIERQRAA